jgi:hypothetical protein
VASRELIPGRITLSRARSVSSATAGRLRESSAAAPESHHCRFAQVRARPAAQPVLIQDKTKYRQIRQYIGLVAAGGGVRLVSAIPFECRLRT